MEDDIAKILDGLVANQQSPSPCAARVGNSPFAGAVRRRGHARNVVLGSARVKLTRPALSAARVESGGAPSIIAPEC
jgi:hypothetical protein